MISCDLPFNSGIFFRIRVATSKKIMDMVSKMYKKMSVVFWHLVQNVNKSAKCYLLLNLYCRDTNLC